VTDQRAPDCEVVTTRGGARAVRDLATGEIMHPVVGPFVEAHELYVVPARLERRLRAGGGPVRLLDVGLGAGSNAIAAWTLSESLPASASRLEIVSFERSLSAFGLALAEEHAGDFGFEGEAGRAARALHEEGQHETPRTSWRLVLGELPATLASEPEASADVVFWDPFSPRANPSLWTLEAFAAVRRLCRPGATLHTYSAATATRSALLLAGFAVGWGEATGEAKQTTTAAVSVADLQRPLDRRWLERLARSSAPFPSDAPADALARVTALSQFSATVPLFNGTPER
jgi:queuine tRNA-ribosyltransferase